MAATQNAPTVVVPMDEKMATEPARSIGQMFADKVMVKSLVSAIVGVVALVFKITLDGDFIDNITTIVTLGSMIFAGAFAQWDARIRAQEQAEATRAVVYAPSTVADIVAADQSVKEVEAVVIPAPASGIS